MPLCSFWFSCNYGTPSNKCGPCPEIAELAPFIEVKIVDKVTGSDIFLSPTSPYKFGDLKITSSAGANVNVYIDSTQKNNRFIKLLSDQSQTFILKLATLSADTMNVVAKMDSPKCCPLFAIRQITLNRATVCSPCSLIQMITIKK